MCHLAIRYHTAVYSELERVPCSDLFIVERGVVAKRGHLGLVGMCFGKDVILSNDNLRDLGDAIALSTCTATSFDLPPRCVCVQHVANAHADLRCDLRLPRRYSSHRLCAPWCASAFVQAISLTQKDIFDLLPDYPQARPPPSARHAAVCASAHASLVATPLRRACDRGLSVTLRCTSPCAVCVCVRVLTCRLGACVAQAFFIVRKAALRMAMTRALVKAAGIVKRSKISKASTHMAHTGHALPRSGVPPSHGRSLHCVCCRRACR
jgi:hypothetical protein